MTGRRRWSVGAAVRMILLALALIWTLFPVYWMLVTAFKTTLEIFSLRLQLVPAHPTLENFVEMWTGVVPVRTFFANSVVTSGLTCALTIAVSVLAAFAFSRMKFRYKQPLQLSLLLAQMFPFIVLLIPLYLIFLRSHLLNTNQGLVLAFASTAIPVGVWFMKGFMDSVPLELDEAARIDGCTEIRLLRDVLLPLMLPGILMAASILASLPPILGFVAVQRWLISGLLAGAMKG